MQDSANAVSANTFLSRDKGLEYLPSPFSHSCQTICKIVWTALLIGPSEYCPISSSRTCKSEAVLGFGWRFQNSLVHRSPDMISSFHLNLESYKVAIILFQAFEVNSRGGIVERHVQCAQNPCILLNLPLRLAAVGSTLQWTLWAEINKQLRLLFATTLTLTLRHSNVIVV